MPRAVSSAADGPGSPRGLNLADDGRNIPGPVIGLSGPLSGTGRRPELADAREIAPVAPELPASRLCRRKSRLGPVTDGLGLMLGDSREDMHGQPVGLWEVDRDELDAAFHEVRDECDVTGEPVQLRDNSVAP